MPFLPPGAESDESRLPLSLVCHCNSCREITGQLAAYGVACEKKHVELSVLPKSQVGTAPLDDDHRRWLPAAELLHGSNDLSELCLAIYRSSPRRNKMFCSNCGVSFAHVSDRDAIPKEWGWPEMLAIMLPTIDRTALEKDWWRPSRAMWTAVGIPWIRDHVKKEASDLEEHPLAFRNKVMGDDITADLEMFAAIGEPIDLKIAE